MNLLDPDVVFADESDDAITEHCYLCSDPNRCNLGSRCDGTHSYSNYWRHRMEEDRSEASLVSPLTKAPKENESEIDHPLKVAIRGGPTSVVTGGPTSVITGGPTSVVTGGPASINTGGVDVAVVKTSEPTEADTNSDCDEIAPDSEDGASQS